MHTDARTSKRAKIRKETQNKGHHKSDRRRVYMSAEGDGGPIHRLH
jgi:hypothetical protein